MRAVLVLVALLTALVGCQQPQAPAPASGHNLQAEMPSPRALRAPSVVGPIVTHDTGDVTGTYPSLCHSPQPELPDPSCTPGAVRDDITNDRATQVNTICQAGWTATVRAPSNQTRRVEMAALAAYGLPVTDQAADDHELDHLVPLELGGSNDVANLWPQPGAHNPKDPIENRLKRDVCAGRISLTDAQRQIAGNWLLLR